MFDMNLKFTEMKTFSKAADNFLKKRNVIVDSYSKIERQFYECFNFRFEN